MPRRLAQAADLLAERGGDGGRHAARARPDAGACQLLEVERVAAALLVQPWLRGAAEQRLGLGLCERAEPIVVTRRSRPAASSAASRLFGTWPARNASAISSGAGGAPQQVGDQLQRGGVGPVHVVEDQHDGLAHRHALEQRADRAVGVEALVLQAPGAGRRRRRQHARELPTRSPISCSSCAHRVRRRGRPGRRPRSRTAARARASAPRPTNTGCRRAVVRSASSASSRVLPIPLSPPITTTGRGRAQRVERFVQCRKFLPPPYESRSASSSRHLARRPNSTPTRHEHRASRTLRTLTGGTI